MMYRAWLGDVFLALAATREAAVEAAIREYEFQAGEPAYGEYPLIGSREELMAVLSVEACDEE